MNIQKTSLSPQIHSVSCLMEQRFPNHAMPRKASRCPSFKVAKRSKLSRGCASHHSMMKNENIRFDTQVQRSHIAHFPERKSLNCIKNIRSLILPQGLVFGKMHLDFLSSNTGMTHIRVHSVCPWRSYERYFTISDNIIRNYILCIGLHIRVLIGS